MEADQATERLTHRLGVEKLQLGSGGVLPPTLAVWAPNLLFGAGAVYLLLTART